MLNVVMAIVVAPNNRLDKPKYCNLNHFTEVIMSMV
jgi:hypothetical protein